MNRTIVKQCMMYIQVGDSALMQAAWWGHTAVVEKLVMTGADVNMQNNVCQKYTYTGDMIT